MDTVLLSPVLDSSAKDVKSPTREIDYKHHRIDVTVRSVNDAFGSPTFMSFTVKTVKACLEAFE